MPEFTPVDYDPFDETEFQSGIRATPWYSEFTKSQGAEPNLDDPNYDYRKAWAAGARPVTRDPSDNQLHWPSTFKGPDHPNRFVNGVDTITGRSVTPVDFDPFETAAARTVRSVKPPGGRTEGKTTRALDVLGTGVYNVLASPSRLVNAQMEEHNLYPGKVISDSDPSVADMVPSVALDMMGLPGVFGAVPKNAAGIFGGQLANTSDWAKWQKAKEMAANGLSKEQIWNETGWFQTATGKWKFEIPDNTAHASVFGRERLNEGKDQTADKFMYHNNLYTSYPHLRDTKVSPISKDVTGLPGYENAHGVSMGGEIGIKPGMLGEERNRSTALHEMQHEINRYEGDMVGTGPVGSASKGSIAATENELKNFQNANAVLAETRKILGIQTGESLAHVPHDKFQGAISIATNRLSHEAGRSFETGGVLHAVRNEADRQRALDWVYYTEQQLAEKLAEAKASVQAAHDKYRRQASEVEARNVQGRMKMTPEERRATPPWATEDVPRKDQILGANTTDKAPSIAVLAANAKGPTETLYHGTSKDKGFSKLRDTRNGTWFDTNPKEASNYAFQNDSMGFRWEPSGPVKTNQASRVIPMTHKFENTLELSEWPQEVVRATNYKKAQSEFFDKVRAEGYDSVRMKTGDGNSVVVSLDNSKLSPKYATGDQKLKPKALYSNATDDKTSIAVLAANAQPGIRAYHSSPHDFNKFDMSKIGTGEGAQAYGHGLYFAENEGVAKSYKTAGTISTPIQYKEQGILSIPRADFDAIPEATRRALVFAKQDSNVAESIFNARSSGQDAIAKELERLRDSGSLRDMPMTGKMYEVNINAHPNQFLDWDKPLRDQTPEVTESLRRGQRNLDSPFAAAIEQGYAANYTGRELYDKAAGYLAEYGPSGKGATYMGRQRDFPTTSKMMRDEAGIPGIKYLDQGSRNMSITVANERIAKFEKKLAAARAAGDVASATALERDLATMPRPTYNYVINDDKIITIVKKYGLAGLSMLPPATAAFLKDKLTPVDHNPFEQKQ